VQCLSLNDDTQRRTPRDVGGVATLTVNPAVDLAAQATSVRPGHKVRTFGERYDPGGGGINVARVITALGGDALALFASGGVTGRFVEEMMTAEKLPWRGYSDKGRLPNQRDRTGQSNGLEYRFVSQGLVRCANILEALRHVEADWWWQVAACPRERRPTSMRL
jgi:6-phosphofructokinase 2